MNNPDNNQATKTITEISRWKIYVAAGFGAFCLGFGDLVKNGKTATIIKMSEAIQEYLLPGFGAGALIALVLLVALGMGYCWIHGPSTLVDAFNRGFSVFAILAVTASTNKLPTGISSPASTIPDAQFNSGMLRSAYAQENPSFDMQQPAEQAPALGQAIIELTPLKDKTDLPVTTVTLRDAKNRKVIGVEQFQGFTFTVKRPPGHYVLEVETPGYRRTEVELTIGNQVSAYAISMNETELPLSIQRLYGPESEHLQELRPSVRYKLIGIGYMRLKDFQNAIRYYDKALAEQRDDIQAYNFKGYSLFRLGKYDDALATLQAAIIIDPTSFNARLNSAKVYCAQKRLDLAVDIIAREPRLSTDDLRATLQDKEFLRVCLAIQNRISELENGMK